MRLLLSIAICTLFLASPGMAQKNDKNPMVLIHTDFGDIKVELYNETPQHRDNFLKLVREGFYNDLLFHRCINEFMVQGGDPNSRGAAPGAQLGSGGPGYTVEAEINSKFVHTKGALSAARQGDQVNPEKRSSGSQFFLMHGRTFTAQELDMMAQRANQQAELQQVFKWLRLPENKAEMDGWNTLAQARNNTALEAKLKELLPKAEEKFGKVNRVEYTEEHKKAYATIGGAPHLDGNYTVFGHVVEGLDIIDKIATTETNPQDRPLKDIKMSMEVIE